MERKDCEDKIQAIDDEIVQIQQDAELRLSELTPDQKIEYSKLLQENRSLIQEINLKQNEVDEMDGMLVSAESKLKIDTNKLKAHQLKEQINTLERQKADLELQAGEANLSLPEQKEKLKAKVTEDTEVIKGCKNRTKELKKLMDNYEKEIRDIDEQLSVYFSFQTHLFLWDFFNFHCMHPLCFAF